MALAVHSDAGSPRLRVLFGSTHSFPPQRVGGIELSTHELCLALQQKGHDVAVLADLASHDWLGMITRIRRKLPGGQGFPGDRVMGYPVFRGWGLADGVRDVVRRFAPTVAVAQGTGVVPLARAFLEAGVPTVLYLRDVEFQFLGGAIPEDERLLVLANSEFTASRAHQELGVEAHVVLPLVQPEAYRVSGRREKVVFVNPHPMKGVEIAMSLAESRPDIPFLFVQSWGLPPDVRKAYRKRAAALPNVEWRGAVRDTRDIYRQARVLIVPSIWAEGWGRVVTEAHVSGIPVLSSNRGGLAESVGPGGIVVDPDAPRADWLAALSALWDDPQEYARRSAAASEYSRRPAIQPEGIILRLIELLSAHAGGRAGDSAPSG